MTPDQIPDSVMQRRNDPITVTYARTVPDAQFTRELIAHFWPAIKAHIRKRMADNLQRYNPDRDADFSAGVDWATDHILLGGY